MSTNPESAAVEAVAWDYCPEIRIAVTNGKGGANMTLNGHGAPAGISLYHGDYVSELQSALDALRGEVAAAERRVAELEKLMAAARRAIGDHHAPNDCYATGPLTGDEFLDLVQCPACAFLDQYDAITKESP